ncbi:hypothetical protein F4779DRAFT_641266 [Xylariaceae sp. FL0662B]|nr:hypothetical protein F4779DRAFT_641266 [Xylariaceae sp. FL0662B]
MAEPVSRSFQDANTSSTSQVLQPKKKSHLPEPFTSAERRIIKNRTNKLILKRNNLDSQLSESSHWPLRDKLLRQQKLLQERERRHIRKRLAKLTRLKRYYRNDPLPERARDCKLVRKLLRKFKRHLGLPLDVSEKPKPEMTFGDSDGMPGRETNGGSRIEHDSQDVIANNASIGPASIDDKATSKKRKRKNNNKDKRGDGMPKKRHKSDLSDGQVSPAISNEIPEILDQAALDSNS